MSSCHDWTYSDGTANCAARRSSGLLRECVGMVDYTLTLKVFEALAREGRRNRSRCSGSD